MSLRIASYCLVAVTSAVLLDGSSAAHHGPADHAAQPVRASVPSTPSHGPKSRTARSGADEAAPGQGARPGVVEQLWVGLAEGNRRFMAGHSLSSEVLLTRQRLADGQHPQVIVLGCADSRVSPELVFDQGLGDLFVVRTAGNVVDEVALGSLEYAASHLESPVLLVLGHEKCGAVAAAASGETMPTVNLQAIVSRITPAFDLLPRSLTNEQLAVVGIEANIQRSARDLLAASPILRDRVASGQLTIIKAVYRLETGEVVRL